MKPFIKQSLIILLLVLSLCYTACTININSLLNVDEREIVNKIQENKVLTSNVTVVAYNFMGKKVSQGSGVIYKSDGVYFYAITNNHVIYEGYHFNVMDAYGDMWETKVMAYDANYDLAVVRFKITTNNEYFIPEIVSEDPNVNDNIISITNPLGVVNSVTFGIVQEYLSIEALDNDTMMTDEGSNVKFDVIKHNAPIDSGSSGGAIFNYEYKICGINFASGRGKSGNFISGYAIQPTKVIEFLTDNNLI